MTGMTSARDTIRNAIAGLIVCAFAATCSLATIGGLAFAAATH